MKKRQEPSLERVVPSIKQAAQALGVSEAILRAARAAGSPGFIGKRVRLSDVKGFLSTFKQEPESPGGLADHKLRKLKAEADLREFQVQVKRGQYLLRSHVEASLARVHSKARAILQAKLEREFPSIVAGLSVVEVRAKGKALFDDICAEFRALEGPWTA